jgi:hypothetical protein
VQGHTEAAQGGRVTWAGTAHISQGSGQVTRWDDASGHYRPAASLRQSAVQAGMPADKWQQHPETTPQPDPVTGRPTRPRDPVTGKPTGPQLPVEQPRTRSTTGEPAKVGPGPPREAELEADIKSGGPRLPPEATAPAAKTPGTPGQAKAAPVQLEPPAGGPRVPLSTRIGSAVLFVFDILAAVFVADIYRTLAAIDQAKFDAAQSVIDTRAAELADEARSWQQKLKGRTMWVNVRLTPVYRQVEDTKPFESGEFTNVKEVLVDTVRLGTEYLSSYRKGEKKVVLTNGAYVNVYEWRDTIELSFLYPYDPSVMTVDELERRFVENVRETAGRNVLPQEAVKALTLEREALVKRRTAIERGK